MGERGRPTKYRPELLAEIRRLYSQGKTDKQVCDFLGIALRTLNDWKHRHAEFLHTLKECKGVADDLVEAALYSRAVGYTYDEQLAVLSWGKWKKTTVRKHHPPDILAAIFWLKNRRPDAWRDKGGEVPEKLIENAVSGEAIKVDFTTFCTNAGYPAPLEEQIGFTQFGFDLVEPRLLLGARGYGKTDYLTILRVAYDIYLHGVATSNLILTKSKIRNSAIMQEIAHALIANGVELEKQNASCVRVAGLVGKDHSVEAITIKTSMRGRHPKRAIMDDPVTDEDVSQAERKLVKRKYNELMKLCSNVLVIGQPAHKHDLYAELRPLLKVLELPHGTIPKLDHDLEAQRLAGVDEASIQASYFLKIVSDGGAPFEKIRYVDQFIVGDSVAWVDPSHKGGDLTALTILRAYGQGIQVVGFVWKKAWNHCLDDIEKRLKQFGVRRLAFETNNLGTMPIEILQTQLAPKGIGVVGRDSIKNKHSKIMAAGVASEILHLSKQSDRAYIDGVIQYEYGAEPDDAPDSLASCLDWIGLIKGKK